MKTIQLVKYTCTLCLCLAFSTSLFAQTTPSNQLSATDVEHFIKSFKPLVNDLNAVEVAYSDVENSWTGNAKIRAIFTKHGWGEDFALKFQAVIASYSYLKSMQQFDEIPAEQQQMMGAVKDQLKAQYANMVSEADIALVKTRFNALDKLFQED